jgi:TM2 domain-containing membrane protein YozV
MGQETLSPKSRLGALLFCLLLGVFGAHRFYVGKVRTAILMILTLGGLGIWSLVDFILIVIGSFRDKQGKRVLKWFEPGSISETTTRLWNV